MRNPVLFALALCGASVAHAQLPAEPDFLEMAKASAALNGITVAEAIRRADLQNRIVDLQNRYLERFPNDFAGIVLEPTATSYTFKVLLKGGPKNALLELAGAPDLAALGREATVARSFAELQREQLRLLDALEANGVRAGSSINLAENGIHLTVPDKARVDALAAAGAIALPSYAKVRQGDPRVIEDATIRGGMEVEGLNEGCQTGFSVRNYSGVRGVVTAAHCEDSLTTVTTAANIGALQQATTTAQYVQGLDIQWHASSANLYPNQIQYGSNVVSITGTAGVSVMQPNATEVCLVRWRTQTTSCGRIYNTSYYVQHPTYGRSGPFVGVNPVGSLLLSEPGDSGGPWFFGNKAYGVHSGRYEGSISFFTPADKLSALSVVVQTSP